MYQFDVEDATLKCVLWIREFFEKNGKDCNAVLGISGGKDSSVAAALCVKALGKDRVIGVLLPNGHQTDIDCSYELCNHLGIKHYLINIEKAYNLIHPPASVFESHETWMEWMNKQYEGLEIETIK